MDLGLTDRVAFVTGASQGLGFAVARQLAAEGCHVAICSRSQERIQQAADALRDMPGNVIGLTCDVTDEPAITHAINQVVAQLGQLNILVTNAGGPPTGFVDDFDAADWREGIELNLISTINLVRHALPHLRKASESADGFASILMITSVSAKQPIPNLYLSNTSRAGVQGFAKSLSEELGSAGITVNTILPGFTRTERLSDLASAIREKTGQSVEEIEAAWGDANALKRIGSTEEFAAAAAFLVSGNARYITGVSLNVDGGRSKGLL
jgi:3-oxoacyl-[acyl-carrier protein] reductase